MAIFHLHVKTIGRSQGRSATGAAAYRAGVRLTDTRTGLVFDYSRKRGVDGAEILGPGGAAPERAALWNLVEQCEKRGDAQVCREIEIALPRELTPTQMRECVRAFVREQFIALGMIADIAFHHLAGSNPHAHILLTLREWQGDGFGLKRRDWNDHALCERWRQGWADHANRALDEAGQLARIDPRSLEEQTAQALTEGRHTDAIALDRMPTIHERGSPTASAYNAQAREANAARLVEWAAIEKAAASQARLMPPAGDRPTMTRSARLVAADAAFIADMGQRRDLTASRWRYYDDQARAAAQWLEAHSRDEAQRKAAQEQAVQALRAARATRADWQAEHSRPPWWRFWQRPRWMQARAQVLAPVAVAKRAAAQAQRRASPAALAAVREMFAAHQVEHTEALRERRRLALTPSEKARAEQDQRACADSLRQAWAAPPRPGAPHLVQGTPPTRPRPGRRR